MVDSLRYLQNVGEQVQQAFLRNKTILSFQEYMDVYFERPRVHARDSAQRMAMAVLVRLVMMVVTSAGPTH